MKAKVSKLKPEKMCLDLVQRSHTQSITALPAVLEGSRQTLRCF